MWKSPRESKVMPSLSTVGLRVAANARIHDAVDRHAAVMQIPRSKHALTLESGALDHPIRGLVADHDERVQADGRGRCKGPIRDEPKGTRAHTATTCLGC